MAPKVFQSLSEAGEAYREAAQEAWNESLRDAREVYQGIAGDAEVEEE